LDCHPEPAKTAKDLTDSDGGTHTKLCDPLANARSLGALRLPRDDKTDRMLPAEFLDINFSASKMPPQNSLVTPGIPSQVAHTSH
jgi:hypothetical protein